MGSLAGYFASIIGALKNIGVLIIAFMSYNTGKRAETQKIQETTLDNIDKANKAIARARSDAAYRDKLRKKYNLK